MDPAFAFTFGFAAAAAVAAPIAVWQRRRLIGNATEMRRLKAEVEARREILEATPDGLYIWDRLRGTEHCSRRLAVLLDLAEGTQARFPNLLERFEGDAGAMLADAAQALQRRGTPFDLLLPVRDGTRIVHAVGLRAGTPDGRTLADLLWMRDVAGTGASSAGEGLAAARESFHQVLDALPLPVWLRDADLRVVFANRACGGGMVTEPTRPLAHRARDERRPLAERHLVALGDAPKLLEVTEAPLEGWPGTLGFAIDRSDAEEMEGEFARRTAARDQVLEALGTALAIFGADTRLQFFNSAYADLFRLDPGWLSSEPALAEVLVALREARRLPEVADFRAYRDEQLALFQALTGSADSLLHLPDGTTVRCRVTPHGTGGLVFAYEDVTARLALERQYNTLTAVQGETLDNLYEGVAVFGSDGRMTLCNPVFAQLWRLGERDLGPRPHLADFVETLRGTIVGIDDEDWPEHKERVIARMLRREPSTGRILRTDGKVIDYANVPLPDGAVLLSYLNVTDSIRVEMALRERTEALQEADRLKSEFIANVSFEIRTPLNTIVGFADILANQYFGALNPRQLDYARGIQESAESLLSVVNDILDLASIQAGQLTLELDTVDVHTMLVGVLGLIRERARHKGLTLEFDCTPDIGWIVGDEKRLKQVLFHLLSNAVQFTPPRGTIRLEAAREKDEMVVAVIDNGVGIPAKDRQRLFAPFERGPGPKPALGGAGLGLSLVKSFVELHGGRVELRSRPKRGTKITVRLPVESEEPQTERDGIEQSAQR